MKSFRCLEARLKGFKMSDKESLPLEYQQVLRDQVIDENGPGAAPIATST